MLGDGICNVECMNEECEFDYQDCECNEGCYMYYEDSTWNYPYSEKKENENSSLCLVPECGYNMINNPDPFIVRQMILAQMFYKNFSFRNMTELPPDCTIEAMRKYDNITNDEKCPAADPCNNEQGLWCMGRSTVTFDITSCLRYSNDSCLIFNTLMVDEESRPDLENCPTGYSLRQDIALLFSNETKLKICLPEISIYSESQPNTFYVEPLAEPVSEGTGSLITPFKSLYYALTQVYSDFTKIFLKEGEFILKYKEGTYERDDPFDPLNFQLLSDIYLILIEGEKPEKPSVIFWESTFIKDSLKIVKISSSALIMHFKNIIFDGSRVLKEDCTLEASFCLYCPSIVSLFTIHQNWTWVDDRRKRVSDEMQIQNEKCSHFSDTEIFVLTQEAIFENVVFRDFRMKFKTLIRSSNSLNLTNVNFTSLEPKPGGNVVEVSCTVECSEVDFNYNKGKITDLNPGHEITDYIELGSFLKVNTIRSIILTGLESTFNFLYSNAESSFSSYFFNVVDFNGTFTVSNSNFSNIYANSLFDIDVIKLKYQSLGVDGIGVSESYSQQHFSMVDVKFENIYTSENFLRYSMRSVTHNIQIIQVLFDKVHSGSSSLINLDYSGTLKKKDKVGDKVKLAGESSIIKRREVRISNITIKNSTTAGFLLNIIKNANVFITNLTISELFDGSYLQAGEIIENYKKNSKYLSVRPISDYVEDLACQGAIRVLGCYNISLHNISISNSFCEEKEAPSGLIVSDSEAHLNVTDLSLTNVSSSSSNAAGVHFSNLNHQVNLENISLASVTNNDGSCIEMSECFSISWKNFTFQNSYSENLAPVKIYDFQAFDLNFFNVLKSSSTNGDGGVFSLMASGKKSAVISIVSGVVSEVNAFGNGGFLNLDAINTNQLQSLTIDNLKLDHLEADDGVFLFISKKVKFSQSNVSNIEIFSSSGKKAMIFDSHLKGVLHLENFFIENSKNLQTSGIFGEYENEELLLKVTNITIKDCQNSERVFLFTGKSNKSLIEFEKVLISNISNSDYFANGFLILSITLTLKKVNFSQMNSFLLISNSAQAIVSSAEVTNTFAFVVQAFNKAFFSCTFCEITKNSGTIITASTGSYINLLDSSIYDNYYENSQVFLLSIDSPGDFKNIIKNTVIENNYAEKIDLIKFMNTEVQISGLKLQGNIVGSLLYTGIFIFKSNITINSSEFANQTSERFGSFIYAIGNSRISIFDSSFDSGFSGMDGGAIYLHECELVSLDTCKFSNNSALVHGGSIYSSLSPVTIKNTHFTSSKSSSGIDIYLNNGSLEITQTTFKLSECFSFSHCEAVFATGNFLTLENVIIADSIYPTSGLFTSGFSQVSIRNSSFTRLKGTDFGALRLDGNFKKEDKKVGNVFISGSLFEENSSGENGGALNLNDMTLFVEDTVFIRNSAENAGGALYLVTPVCSNCSFEITGSSQMVFNRAGKVGGAIKWDDYKPSISEEVIVENNSALYGAKYASKAAKLEIFSKRLLQDSEDFSVSLDQIPPGQAFNDSLKVLILDTYDNIMVIDNSSSLILEPVDMSLLLQGNWTFKALNGTFNLTNFIPRANPGSNQTLRIFTDGINPQKVPNDDTVYKNDLFIKMSMRPCSNGEKIGEFSCTICQELKYLIKPAPECKMCPKGGICPGGDKIWLKKGYYRTHYLSEIVYACPMPDSCLGNKEGWVTECLKGYSGITCAVCESGYTKTSAGKCNKCPDPTSNYVIMICIIIAVVAVCIILVKSSIKSAFTPKAKHSIYIKIFTNYLQLVFLTAQFNLSWPSYVITLFGIQKSAATATDSLFSVDCYFSDGSLSNSDMYYFKMIFYSALPLVIFVISILVWIGICMTKENFQPMKREMPLTMIVLFFLVYPNIVKFMFSNFACSYFDMLGKFLNDNYSVKCWNKEHSKYSLDVAVPSIVLWSVGVPTIVLIVMIKRRNLLYKEDNRVVFGFLFNGYKTSIFFWEFIIMYRKILIICVIVFIAEVSTAVQGLTVALLLIFSLFIQYEVGPYNSDELNHMEIEALITATLTIYCGLYYLTEDIGEVFKIILFVIIVCGNSYFIVLWFYWMLKALVDMLAKAIPALKFTLKKGDAFEDDFNREELVISGTYFNVEDGKRHYTFMRNEQVDERPFTITCIPELYARVIAQNDEFSENIYCESGEPPSEEDQGIEANDDLGSEIHDKKSSLGPKNQNFTPRFNDDRRVSSVLRANDNRKVSSVSRTSGEKKDSNVLRPNDERRVSNVSTPKKEMVSDRRDFHQKQISYVQDFVDIDEDYDYETAFRKVHTERGGTKEKPMIAIHNQDFSQVSINKSFANENSPLLDNQPVFITEEDQVDSYNPSKAISPDLVVESEPNS
jgi:predicted outer membrane repeat protein